MSGLREDRQKRKIIRRGERGANEKGIMPFAHDYKYRNFYLQRILVELPYNEIYIEFKNLIQEFNNFFILLKLFVKNNLFKDNLKKFAACSFTSQILRDLSLRI